MVPLGDVMARGSGSVNPALFPDQEFELYSIPAHDRGGPEILRGSAIGSAKQPVRPGDVMISKIIPHIRRARIVAPFNGRRQVASGEWIVFRSESFAPSYLRHFLLSDVFHRQFMNTVADVGGSLVRARPTFVKSIPAPLPPLPEQRRIAAILDTADALRAKRREVIAHVDSLSQAIFHEMFGLVPDSTPLSELVTEFRYGTSTKSTTSGYPTLRIPNVIGGSINTGLIKTVPARPDELERLKLRDGDLLFVRTNGNPENVGRCAPFSLATVSSSNHPHEPWIFASYLIRARVPTAELAGFISTYMATKRGRRQLREHSRTSAGQFNINIAGLSSIRVPSAPHELQREFASRITAIDAQRTRREAALAAADELFASLQSRAFTGGLS
jgi:type I restriction enzyme S subunit